jgi:hypothetical protein
MECMGSYRSLLQIHGPKIRNVVFSFDILCLHEVNVIGFMLK